MPSRWRNLPAGRLFVGRAPYLIFALINGARRELTIRVLIVSLSIGDFIPAILAP